MSAPLIAPLTLAPLSIPSPPAEWSGIPYGRWLNDAGLTWVPADLTIKYYAICILIGIVAAVVLTRARLKARGAEPGVVFDVAVFAIIFGIIGARAWHVLTHPDDYFGPGTAAWWAISEGGIAIFGALLGGALGVYVGCRLTGLRFWSFADALVPGLLLAQAIGRLGNWFNQELFGLPTYAPWGLEIDRPNPAIPLGLPDDILFQPTFLFESAWNILGVIALLAAEKRFARVERKVGGADVAALEGVSYRLQWGRLTGLYLVWYGTGRIFFESIRLDPSELLLGTRVNIWGALLAVVIGFLIIIIQGRRHPGVEPSPYVPGREWTPDAAVDSPDTYSDTAAVAATADTDEAGTVKAGTDKAGSDKADADEATSTAGTSGTAKTGASAVAAGSRTSTSATSAPRGK